MYSLEPSLPLSVGLGSVCGHTGGLELSSRQRWLVPNQFGHIDEGESTSHGAIAPAPQRPAHRAVDANMSCHGQSPWIGASLPTRYLFTAQTEFH